MNPVRVWIADDERPARLRVRELLARHPDFQVVGESENGPDTVNAVRSSAPDLLLLDVQMPGLNGFGVLEALAPGELPVTVFVTAYDQYALAAFEARALDYLLKPFSDERGERVLARALRHIRDGRSAAWAERVRTVLGDGAGGRPPLLRLPVRGNGRVVLLRPEQIDWIEAAGVYVHVHAGAQAHLHRESLARLEVMLRPWRFARIHRSTLVNLDRIRELSPRAHGDFAVTLADGRELRLSRGYRAALEAVLGHSL